MMRSMFAAVSGLRAHQLMMDVVGDNIANINTPGFKASQVVFEDTLSQLLRGGSAAGDGVGGVNPEEVGLGVRAAGTETIDTQGAIQNTGRPTDVAIQGAGFFITRVGSDQLFTRAGSFSFDDSGQLVDPSGAVVQGWVADPTNDKITTTGPAGDIKLPLGQAIPPVATTDVVLGGNLSADAVAGDKVTTAIEIVDSLGASHRMTFEYDKTATPNEWTLKVTDDKGNQVGSDATLTFDSVTGNLTSPAAGSFPSYAYTDPNTNATSTFTADFGTTGDANAIRQYGGESTAAALSQDGAPSGYLRSYSVADDGTISGVFSNGRSKVLAQLALATFSNPSGLTKQGDGHLRAAAGSGLPSIGTAGTNGRGSLAAGALEMSNVDLGQEFTDLIIAQRGFQANSRVITASDELLQDLVNLKH